MKWGYAAVIGWTAWAGAAQAAGFACIAEEAARRDYSGTISLMHGGESVAEVARGQVGGPDSAAITGTTRFNIGSANKMFTAVAVAQLADAGKLGFDDPIGKYVPELTAEARAVTLHQLLTHTSGLGDFFRPQNIGVVRAARKAADLLPVLVEDKPQFPPGSPFSYSNSGFALLGIVVERVSGEVYADYIQKHIFAPAGMTATSLDAASGGVVAQGMTRMRMMGPPPGGPPGGGPPPGMVLKGPPPSVPPLNAQMPKGDEPLRPAPNAGDFGSSAGSAYSTAADLQKFMAALRAGTLTKSAVTAPQVDAGRGMRYAYGFGVMAEDGLTWTGHNGGTPGANAEIHATTDGAWSAAVLANRDPPLATEMFRYIQGVAKAGGC